MVDSGIVSGSGRFERDSVCMDIIVCSTPAIITFDGQTNINH
jgi:hypothetical protein